MNITQEVVKAEMSYRIERAQAAALRREARAARPRSQSLWHRLWAPRSPARRMTPALP